MTQNSIPAGCDLRQRRPRCGAAERGQPRMQARTHRRYRYEDEL